MQGRRPTLSCHMMATQLHRGSSASAGTNRQCACASATGKCAHLYGQTGKQTARSVTYHADMGIASGVNVLRARSEDGVVNSRRRVIPGKRLNGLGMREDTRVTDQVALRSMARRQNAMASKPAHMIALPPLRRGASRLRTMPPTWKRGIMFTAEIVRRGTQGENASRTVDVRRSQSP